MQPDFERLQPETQGTIGNERFSIYHTLGRGGMGVVYAARSLDRDGHDFALKLGAISNEPYELLKSHDIRHAVALRPIEEIRIGWKTDLAQRQALIQGQTLQDKMGGKPLSVHQVAHYMGQLATTLRDTERAGVVHGDIKPANLMADAKDNLHVIDWDSSKKVGSQDDILGTWAYLSPESVQAYPISVKQDVYAAGMTTAHLLLGRIPRQVRGGTGEEIRVAIEQYRGTPPIADPLMQRIVAQAVHWDTAQRSAPIDFQANLAAFAEARQHYTAEELSELGHHVATRSSRPEKRDVMLDAHAAQGLLEDLTPEHPRHRTLTAISKLVPDLRRIAAGAAPAPTPVGQPGKTEERDPPSFFFSPRRP